MVHKGWARVEYLPYEQAVRARDDYLDAIGKQQYTSTYTVKKDPVVEKSFDDLNGDIE